MPTAPETVEAIFAAELRALRERAKRDISYLGWNVLGYDYFQNLAPFHIEAAEADRRQENILLLAPRNHIKTTVMDVVCTIQQHLNYPNDRILLGAATWDNSKAVLKEIVGHWKAGGADGMLHKLFPEFIPQNRSEEGNTESYVIPCRTRVTKEDSLETTGQDRVVTSRHYELIRLGDLVVRENVPPTASPEQMLRTIEFFRTTTSLLDPTNPRARRTIDGTVWHSNDLYAFIRREPAYARFRKIIVGIQNDANGDPIPVWSRMGVETLKLIRDEVGSYMWAANYMNAANPLSGMGFRREWFRTYSEIPKVISIAITVDLAISDKATADRTAIIVSGVTADRELYVLAVRAGRFTPFETIDILYDLDREWNPSWIGVETTAWQKAMLFILHNEGKSRGEQLPIRALKADANKVRRASVLQVVAERAGIHVRPEHGELIEECVSFPTGQHDDLVDALAYRVQDMYAPEMRPQFSVAKSSRLMTGEELLLACDAAAEAEDAHPWETV